MDLIIHIPIEKYTTGKGGADFIMELEPEDPRIVVGFGEKWEKRKEDVLVWLDFVRKKVEKMASANSLKVIYLDKEHRRRTDVG